jgi:hypothetical protein
MVGSATYKDKVKKYAPFSILEARNIILTILVIGFMYGFNDGQKDFNISFYAYNMTVSMGIAAVTTLVFLIGQRLAGLSAGYRVEFLMWWPGLIVALIISFITRGYIWIPLAGGMFLHHMPGHRLGFFRYGTNMLDNGIIATSGPLACVLFATILKQIHLWFNIFPEGIITQIFWFCLIFAWVNMLPIPPLAGSKMMYHSRLTYSFLFGFISTYALLAYFELFSWILGLIGATIIWITYYLKVEAKG